MFLNFLCLFFIYMVLQFMPVILYLPFPFCILYLIPPPPSLLRLHPYL